MFLLMYIQLLALDILIPHPVMDIRHQAQAILTQVLVHHTLILHLAVAVMLIQRLAESTVIQHQALVTVTQLQQPITIQHLAEVATTTQLQLLDLTGIQVLQHRMAHLHMGLQAMVHLLTLPLLIQPLLLMALLNIQRQHHHLAQMQGEM